jgi:uridine phosphorylase
MGYFIVLEEGILLRKDYPILEFDANQTAVIEPHMIRIPITIPERVVLCFFHEVIEKLYQTGRAKVAGLIKTEMGTQRIYTIMENGMEFALFNPGIGGPLAGYTLEQLIAFGGRKFIACGGAGVLDNRLAVGHLLVPYAAVRDEGLSYHYLAPAREVEVDRECLAKVITVLERHQCQYLRVKTWTTDAFFRETQDKIQWRKDEGCLTVDMECASLCAVAQFRNVKFAQIFYGGDDVNCEGWDHRGWNSQSEIREQVLWLAAEACLEL